MMQKDVLDALDDLGYPSMKDDGALGKAIEGGVKEAEYTKLISWLSSELQLLCNLEEQVHEVGGSEDEGAFLMELSSFLKELGCPYPELTEGPVSQRLAKPSARMDLLNFLITELLAARLSVAMSKDNPPNGAAAKAAKPESSTASHLKAACITLGLPKPPDTITAPQLFSKLVNQVKEQLNKLPNKNAGRPLFIGALSESQWMAVDRLNEVMKTEYKTRAALLLQRLDVTVQSFTWSDRVKKKEDELLSLYKPLRRVLKTVPTVTIADLIASRDDLTLIEKTSSSNLRTGTTTKLNKLMIKNRPPDRGGRPTEIEPPPPEMPPWQQRATGGGGHFVGGPQTQRQAGGRGSGRVQGGGWQGDQGGGRGGYGGGRQDGYHKGQQQQQYPQQQAYGGQQHQYVDPVGQYQQQNYGYQQQAYHQSGYGGEGSYHDGGRGRGRGGRGGRGRW